MMKDCELLRLNYQDIMNIIFQTGRSIQGREKIAAPYQAIIAEELILFAGKIDKVSSFIFSGKSSDELCCTLSVFLGNREYYTVSSTSASYETALFKALSKLKAILTPTLNPTKSSKPALRRLFPLLGF